MFITIIIVTFPPSIHPPPHPIAYAHSWHAPSTCLVPDCVLATPKHGKSFVDGTFCGVGGDVMREASQDIMKNTNRTYQGVQCLNNRNIQMLNT